MCGTCGLKSLQLLKPSGSSYLVLKDTEKKNYKVQLEVILKLLFL